MSNTSEAMVSFVETTVELSSCANAVTVIAVMQNTAARRPQTVFLKDILLLPLSLYFTLFSLFL